MVAPGTKVTLTIVRFPITVLFPPLIPAEEVGGGNTFPAGTLPADILPAGITPAEILTPEKFAAPAD